MPQLASASEHGAVLLDAGILVDVEERRASIWEACQSAAASINGAMLGERMGAGEDPHELPLSGDRMRQERVLPDDIAVCCLSLAVTATYQLFFLCLLTPHHSLWAGSIPEATTNDLLEEVADLVESPTVILGSFDPEFLGLPQ